jgi:hypothetical protein
MTTTNVPLMIAYPTKDAPMSILYVMITQNVPMIPVILLLVAYLMNLIVTMETNVLSTLAILKQGVSILLFNVTIMINVPLMDATLLLAVLQLL